jgi:hypothetical protein
MKTICLDYDGTFTELPDLMFMIIEYCSKNNIKCILATMRYDYEKDAALQKIEEKIKVYYTGRKAKKEFLECYGIYPSVWIDDNPEWLYKDSL